MELSPNQPCPHCGRYKNRGLTVDAIIIKDKSILLIKRKLDPCKGMWALPGGHVEWDEEITQTVRKEVAEETGLTVTSIHLLNVYSKPDRDPKQKITLAYMIHVDGELHAGDDALEAKFFPLTNLPEILAFDHATIINDYVKRTTTTA